MFTGHEKSSQGSMHHHDTMKTIAKAYLSNQECFFYIIMKNNLQNNKFTFKETKKKHP